MCNNSGGRDCLVKGGGVLVGEVLFCHVVGRFLGKKLLLAM
ncbi:hypothetical protein ES703_88724 [subsurface metagenome]